MKRDAQFANNIIFCTSCWWNSCHEMLWEWRPLIRVLDLSLKPLRLKSDSRNNYQARRPRFIKVWPKHLTRKDFLIFFPKKWNFSQRPVTRQSVQSNGLEFRKIWKLSVSLFFCRKNWRNLSIENKLFENKSQKVRISIHSRKYQIDLENFLFLKGDSEGPSSSSSSASDIWELDLIRLQRTCKRDADIWGFFQPTGPRYWSLGSHRASPPAAGVGMPLWFPDPSLLGSLLLPSSWAVFFGFSISLPFFSQLFGDCCFPCFPFAVAPLWSLPFPGMSGFCSWLSAGSASLSLYLVLFVLSSHVVPYSSRGRSIKRYFLLVRGAGPNRQSTC